VSRARACATHGPTRQPGRSGYACGRCERDMLARVLAGETLAAVGRSYGLTCERIRQVVAALEPRAARLGMAARRERAAIARENARAVATLRRARANPPCTICWGPVARALYGHPGARGRTCCPHCAELWGLLRYQLDEQTRQRVRLQQARSSITHPDTHGAARVRHAVAKLLGTARQHARPAPHGPKTVAALAEVARLRQGRQPPEGVAG
jgi:hypothetical protein